MKMQLFSIRDVLAEEYGPIFEARNAATAVRQYKAVMTKDNVNEKDYRLFHVGSFDHESGQIMYVEITQIYAGGFGIKKEVPNAETL